MMPPAFANTAQVSIIPGSGPSNFCSETATCFTPSILSISPGDTIMWTNNDNVDHVVVNGLPYSTQLGSTFDSDTISPGKTYSFTFYNTGTYKYSDKVDKWMVGEVIVVSTQPSSSVPEFGHITLLVLAISIVSTIISSTKIRIR
jgi:predicted secreted protein with PEFG-CTERM motif